MRDIAEITDLYLVRSREMRAIAEGIWDSEERANFLEFINEYERIARALRTKSDHVVLPTRTASVPWVPKS